ncbi:MAG: hypothetical protein U0324_23880 [Polyangiales bacterium]
MRPTALSFTAALALTALPLRGYAQESTPPASRVSLGVRAMGRFGDYALGGLGGQLTVRLAPSVYVALFTDHMVGTRDGALRHDHEVGGMLQLRLLRGARWALFPMVGACANLAVVHAAQSPETSVTDIQFGARAGLGAEFGVGRDFSVGVEGIAVAYLGHALTGWAWRAEVSPELSVAAVGQATVHANYHF